jgi:hypothetical protein
MTLPDLNRYAGEMGKMERQESHAA